MSRVNAANYKRVVGLFKRREDVEDALHALKDDGFELNNVSLLAGNLEGVEGAEEVTEKQGNEERIKAGDYFLMVTGTEERVKSAASILRRALS